MYSRSEGNLYLFEKYYEDEYQSGTYEVVSISVTENGETTDYALADLKMEAKFGVNQEYDGIDELQPVDEEQEEAAAEDAVGISVSTLNENGTIEEQNSIEDALDAARTDVLASTPAMMSLDDDSGISTQAARSGKIVVALDPGHDDRDAGASYYGLREEALTLKIANYCKEELEKHVGVEVYMDKDIFRSVLIRMNTGRWMYYGESKCSGKSRGEDICQFSSECSIISSKRCRGYYSKL